LELRVTLEEAGLLIRLAKVQALAEDVFGDSDKAAAWLRQGFRALDGQTPLESTSTETGLRVVEQILGKIDWGAAA
jgi:putative toxin-antitoxin system antitoxin component (TIGR02293 family)